MESIFIPLGERVEKTEWLCQFLKDTPKWSKLMPTIYIHYDSYHTIRMAQSNIYNGKSRHIRR